MKAVSLLLLVMLATSAWFFPSATPALTVTLLLFGFAAAIAVVFKKHRETYLEDKITRGEFVRKASLEVFGILLAMILAGLAGRYLAQVATSQITHELAKLIVSIVIGLLVGAGVGLLVKRTWGRLIAFTD